MTVKELIELNQMITDVQITVRKDHFMFDQLNIGPAEGIKPPFPTMVPKEERWVGNISVETKREAYYIDKNINAWDDGKDYWQIKPERIPKKWLELEVSSWEVWPASTVVYGASRRNDYGHSHKNINFHGQRINIEVETNGQDLKIQESKEKPKDDEQLEGQMSIEDWNHEVNV